MLKIESFDAQVISEPAPQFATDAEVAFAQWLRLQLEQRYLAQSEANLEWIEPVGEVH